MRHAGAVVGARRARCRPAARTAGRGRSVTTPVASSRPTKKTARVAIHRRRRRTMREHATSDGDASARPGRGGAGASRARRGGARGAAAARRSARRGAARPRRRRSSLARRGSVGLGRRAPPARAGGLPTPRTRSSRRRRLARARRGARRPPRARNRTTVMLSRPPASLAAAISSRPASLERRRRRRGSAATRASRTIDVRPSEQSRNRSPAARRVCAPCRPATSGSGPERARDHRALRVHLGLLLGELAAGDQLADQRVVAVSRVSSPSRSR